MKPLFLWVIVILSFALAACQREDHGALTDSKGQTIAMQALKGKIVVVNYWATWCKPCLTEMPDLNKLYEANQAKIIVLGVNFDGLDNEKMNAFASKLQVKFPLFSQFPIEKYGIQEVAGLPTTFIISPQGKLVKTLQGPQTMASLEQALQHVD